MENTTKDKTSVESGKIVKVKIRKKRQDSAALFTSKEVRQFVSDFVASWIRGDIILRFPTAAELSKKNPLAIGFPADPSVSQELKIKEHYVDMLSICAGITQVSVEEQDKAVAEVFRMLLMFRSANRIEGKIASTDLEKRIAAVEEKLQSTNKIVEQITGFLFQPPKEEKIPIKNHDSEVLKPKTEG
jgi:hypothetical protein